MVVPVETAENTPEAISIVPTDVAELAQVPPDGVLLNVRVSPKQAVVVPPMVDGSAFTVTTAVLLQPVESV